MSLDDALKRLGEMHTAENAGDRDACLATLRAHPLIATIDEALNIPGHSAFLRGTLVSGRAWYYRERDCWELYLDDDCVPTIDAECDMREVIRARLAGFWGAPDYDVIAWLLPLMIEAALEMKP